MMHSHPDWRRGQIILIMCLTLVTVILSIATMVYLTSTHHLFFNYNPSREIVLSIDADFERALTRILANATAQYNKTRETDSDIDEMKETRILANKTFSYWFLATQAAYAGKGLNIEAEWIDDTIQEAKTIPIRIGWVSKHENGYENHDQSYSLRTLEEKLVKLFWYRPNSISAIGSKISIDSVTQGIVGWESTHVILLNLTITSIWSNEDEGIVNVNVVVLREGGEPINDLKKDDFELYWFDPTIQLGNFWWRRAEPGDIIVTYNGGGNYTLRLKPNFAESQNSNKDYFWMWGNRPGYYQFMIVRVKDNRDIIVEAYSYPGIEYVLQENAVEQYYPNNPAKTKETYVFELIPNGTLYWFNTALPVRTSNPVPPVPMPPVKQLRVQATVNYDNDPTDFREVPYQVEVWDSKYLWPSSINFLGWRKRFVNGSKLVFEVNYPPGCLRQAVRVIWLDDCDAEAPDPKIEARVTGGLARVDTGVSGAKQGYILWIVVDKAEFSQYFEHVDWSISLRDKFNVSHVEYILTAYDSYRSDAYYIPIKFPEDNWSILPEPDSETGVSKAPVRIVAFRKSDRVVITSPHPQQGTELHDEIEYKDLIYIPYNTSYFLYSVNASWKKNVVIEYSYLVFAGMIGGYPDNAHSSETIERFKWGSLLTSYEYTVVNGTFNDQNSYTPHRGYALGNSYGSGDYSYWAALYNESWGTCIFASQQLLDLLIRYGGIYKKGEPPDDREVDQLWVWTRRLGASRFMEYDAITLESYGSQYQKTTIDIQKTPKVEFKFAGFMIGGGIADENSKYDDDDVWDDRGSTYARPFTMLYDPTIPVISDIQLDRRSAFTYDDFSTDPSSSWSFSTSDWTWDQENEWLRSTAPDGYFTLAYRSEAIPANTMNIYVLAKARYTTTTPGQHMGLTMLASPSSFYMLDFYRDTSGSSNNFRRLGIWKYSGSWERLRRTTTSGLNLPDNTWRLFYGTRTLQGTGRGSMTIIVYNAQGNQQIASLNTNTPDNSISVSLVGLGLRDENSGGGTISADFDFLVACADADPRRITISGLGAGWIVILRDRIGNIVAQASANAGIATLNVAANPVIRDGSIEIQDSGGNMLFTKNFNVIVGGDVYKCLTSGSSMNAVEECNIYYRMFTCRTQEKGGIDDMPTIVDIYAAYY